MRVVCMKTVMIAGVQTQVLAALTTPAIGNQGEFIASLVPPGEQYWAWPSIPSGRVVGADFTGAPTVSSDPSENLLAVAAITANPLDVLTYNPPKV